MARTYKLTRGVKDVLALALERSLPEHVDEWRSQVEKGEISEEARLVFAAIGWITMRDIRVVPERTREDGSSKDLQAVANLDVEDPTG